jgi:hypothetical protein
MKKYLFLIIALFLVFYSFSQWSTNALINTSVSLAPGEQTLPKVATSGNGTTYISWFSDENENYNVRLQKLDVYGNKLWAQDGILISNNESMSWLTDWDLTVDNNDFAVIVFQDIRNGNNNIYGYRISPDGEFTWGNNGITLSNNAAFNVSPVVCITNSGNIIFAWASGDSIIMQKTSADGTLLWGDSGISLSDENVRYSLPQLIAVGDDDVIMKYYEDSGPVWSPTRHILAMRYNSNGNSVWQQPVVISDAGGISAWTQMLPFINDNDEGFFIAWHDDRDNNMRASIFIQHINSIGEAVYPQNGIEVSLNSLMNHFYPCLVFPDETESIYIFWNEMNGDQNQKGIYGQKVSSTGELLWGNNGKPFIEISSENIIPLGARKENNKMVIIYEVLTNSFNSVIKAMKIDTLGNFVWTPEQKFITSVESQKVHPNINEFNKGQLIIAWSDDRNGNFDIYGQNIKYDGSLGPINLNMIIKVIPDTVVCDSTGPYLVFVTNKTDHLVTVDSVYFSEYLCSIENPDTDFFPVTLTTNETLVLESLVNQTVKNSDYIFDYLHIITSEGNFTSVFLVNSDLITDKLENDNSRVGIKVYPNPAQNNVIFNINSNNSDNELQLFIYNTKGMLINSLRSFSSREIVWDRKDFSGNTVKKGIYI